LTILRWVLLQCSALTFVLIALASPPVLAKDGPPGPDGLPVTSAKHPWNRFLGEPHVDTLSFALHDVAPAARRQFEEDVWTVFTESVNDDRQAELVLRWKQMHHPLIWLFMGKTMARCSVKMDAVGPGRTRVVFWAELASHHKLEGNPMLPSAKKAYAKAYRKWKSDVVADLTARGR
jgi:hypothetical protein